MLAGPRHGGREPPSHTFDRAASVCALAAAAAGIGYAAAFVIVDSSLGSGAFLLLGGVLGVPVLVALYERVRATEPGGAICALVLGVAGALGAAIHGGYDLANALHPARQRQRPANAAARRRHPAAGLTVMARRHGTTGPVRADARRTPRKR